MNLMFDRAYALLLSGQGYGMVTSFVSKTQAISIISVATGYGRRVIEKMMERLEQQGRIKILDLPDVRALRISRTDVDLIVQVLKREIES